MLGSGCDIVAFAIMVTSCIQVCFQVFSKSFLVIGDLQISDRKIGESR